MKSPVAELLGIIVIPMKLALYHTVQGLMNWIPVFTGNPGFPLTRCFAPRREKLRE
jgi:hypothetical protein